MRSGRLRDLLERVEGARVHLAGLRADDRRTFASLEGRTERVRAHASLAVGCHGLGGAEPEQPQRAVDRDVPLLADEHPDARPARQPVTCDVPSRALEHAVARGGERRDAAHLRAGDEADRRIGRERQQLAHPFAHDLLDDRRRRPAHVEAGVLVPRRREPVARQRGWQAAADHEAEIPAARNRDDARVGGGRELLHDLLRLERLLLERYAQPRTQLVRGELREHGPVLE